MPLPAHSEPWWILTRASGVGAALAIGGSVMLGAALAHQRGRRKARYQLHRRLSWAALILLGVHIAAALLDRRHVPVYALVAPFTSPVRTIAAGTGVLAVWGVGLVAVTASRRRTMPRAWRTMHYIAYPSAALALVHSFMGSDVRAMAVVAMVSIAGVALWARRSPVPAPGRRLVRV